MTRKRLSTPSPQPAGAVVGRDFTVTFLFIFTFWLWITCLFKEMGHMIHDRWY